MAKQIARGTITFEYLVDEDESPDLENFYTQVMQEDIAGYVHSNLSLNIHMEILYVGDNSLKNYQNGGAYETVIDGEVID